MLFLLTKLYWHGSCLAKYVLDNAVYALTHMRSNNYENGYCNHQAVQTKRSA